jgi:uncharacterized membrane protein YdbT with pleckstrin-like domain
MDRIEENQFNDIVWKGKPLFKPYFLNHILGWKSSVQILLIGLGFSLLGSLLNKTRFEWNDFLVFIIILCFAGAIQIFLKIITYRNTKYWITNDAVYIQTGAVLPSVISIQKKKILFVDIKKSNIEEKHCVGTVIIDDGEVKKADFEEYKVYKSLIAIKNPEEAIRLL